MKSLRCVGVLACLWLAFGLGQANALDIEYSTNNRLSQVTLSGSHNTYDKKTTFTYLTDAFSHVQVIELDVWAMLGKWYVSHSSPLGNNNNCPYAGVDGNDRNQDLRSCIDNIAAWHKAHPNHELIIVKMEFKEGLLNSAASLDDVIADISGGGAAARIPASAIFKPSDLMCVNSTCTSSYTTPQAAAQAGNWPTMANLRGKIMFTMVPGTVSDAGPRTYAAALRAGTAHLIFPVVFATSSTASADPCISYYTGSDAASRAWTVVFDMQAGVLDAGSVPSSVTSWMANNNYLIFVSDSTPGGSSAEVATGRTRLEYLSSAFHANVINPDQETSGIPYAFDRL
jgi:hypothetical protein